MHALTERDVYLFREGTLFRAYAEFGANEMLQVVELETRAGALARRDSARQHRTQRLALSQDAHPGE